MKSPQTAWLLAAVILGSSIIFGPSAEAAAPPTKAELTATSTWFNKLGWPRVQGKPYVELNLGESSNGSRRWDVKIRGFLIAEDPSSITIFCDATKPDPSSLSRNWEWPFVATRFLKEENGHSLNPNIRRRDLKLDDVAVQAAAELIHPAEGVDDWAAYQRHALQRTAVFLLARCCAQQGRSDLADRLDAALLAFHPTTSSSPEEETSSFRKTVEEQLAKQLIWNAILDCGKPEIGRPALLTEFERIESGFPRSSHHDQARDYVRVLRKMIAEDKAHARSAKDVTTMTKEEQVEEWIFRLRDQNGHQNGQSASCQVFDDDWDEVGGRIRRLPPSPAHHLLRLGFAAVPALIDALNDTRLSRSIGYHRDFYFSHNILRVGDVAEQILSRLSGIDFGAVEREAPPSEDGEDLGKKAVSEAARKWWLEVQAKGEVPTLTDEIAKGKTDSPERAERLMDLDETAAINAIAAVLPSAESPSVYNKLVSVIAKARGPESTRLLRDLMINAPHRTARVIASEALYGRGELEAVTAAVKEWRGREPVSSDDDDFPTARQDRQIAFLAKCGTVETVDALFTRFASLSLYIKLEILNAVSIPPEPALPVNGEAQVVTERWLVDALGDTASVYGFIDSRGETRWGFPRICDIAMESLAIRWPDKYRFVWKPTREERDGQIFAAQNGWRTRHGMTRAVAVAQRADPKAARQPNVIAAVVWKNAPPVETSNFPLAAGQELTIDALRKTITALTRDFPEGYGEFTLCAERAHDRTGFVIEVEWIREHSSDRPAQLGYFWQISRGSNLLYDSSWIAPQTEGGSPISSESQLWAIHKALDTSTNESAGIYILGR